MTAAAPSSFSSFTNRSASEMGSAQKSIMPMPPTVTASASSPSRLPRHLGHGRADIHSSSSFCIASDCVSEKRRLILFSTPSNGRSSVPRPFARS